jgi:hypothetical protein
LRGCGGRGLVDERFESVQLEVPETLVEGQPFERAPQRRGNETTAPFSSFDASLEEAGALEDAQVLRHRRQRHVERLGQRQGRGVAFGGEPRENAASRRIGQRAEDAVEVCRVRSFHACSLRTMARDACTVNLLVYCRQAESKPDG